MPFYDGLTVKRETQKFGKYESQHQVTKAILK